uniref:Uncharacterized protein n=1 Tax=Oryza glumipatula TaxID=40148 RepID=A0A0E0BJ49_9ORYZ
MLMGLNHDCNGRPGKSEAGLPINLNGQAFQAWWPGGCSASATIGNISAENCFLGLKNALILMLGFNWFDHWQHSIFSNSLSRLNMSWILDNTAYITRQHIYTT